MKMSAVLSVIVILVLAGLGVFYLRDMSGPAVSLSHKPGPISSRMDVALTLKDSTGLKSVTVEAVQGDLRVPLLSKQYPPKTKQAQEKFRVASQPGQPGLKEGPFKLEVAATDQAVFHFGKGNSTLQSLEYNYQNKPPSVTVLSTAHNIARGGVGLAVYTVNREVAKSGMTFGDRFYPGYRQSADTYAALFPFPYDMPTDKFVPKVEVVDNAGNERLTGIYFHLLPKAFPRDRLELPTSYIDKVNAEFKDKFPDAKTPLEVFLRANRDLRDHDIKVLSDVGKKTSPVPLWEGVFLRLPNSAPKGTFGQHRYYYYQGKLVDEQTHLGVDLASLPHSNVPAANRGKVVWADDLGIYGQCIIIDHGLGLQTLYGHLSRIGVKVGDEVQKGQTIGNTGDTGLAGGDHLHFGVVVSGEQVNPIEWWDPSWIKNNVTSKLEAAKGAATSH